MDMNFMHTIDAEDVRQFCIHNNLYTIGDCEDYNKMLASVEAHACTPQHIIAIAKDIAEHSDEHDSEIDLSLGNIAFSLCEDVMHTRLTFAD